jgi:Glycosyl hydrolase family 81 N-terminal domain
MGPLREGTSKPTYHYLYGSTADETPPSPQVSETDILFGEFFVGTDNEGETPNSSSRDLPQLLIWKDGDRSNGIDIPRGGELQPLAPNGRMKHSCKPTKSNWCGSLPSFSCFDAKGTQRVLRIIVFMVMMILMIMLIVVLKPKQRVSMNGIGNNGGLAPIFRMPFPIVDRADYGDPASKIILPDLIDPHLLFDASTSNRATSPSNEIPLLKVPFPTGAFWTNLVMAPDALGLSYPIVTYPYAFKWSTSLLQISYPAMRRMIDNISIRDVFEPDLTLGSVDTPYKRHVTKFDPLSVTLRFRANENESESYWETYLVHGMPYVTTKYVKSRPVIKALSTFEKIFCSLDVSSVNMDDSESGNSVTSKWGPCFPTSVR